MSHVLMGALLTLATCGWFLVAMLPALREHLGRTDIAPLRLTSEAADVRFFAHSFRRFVEGQLVALRAATAGRRTVVTTLPDKTGAWYAAASGGIVTLFEGAPESNAADTLVAISEADLRVPAGQSISRELYTSGSLEGGEGNVYRAILADGDAVLGHETTVVRWVDASGSLHIGRNSTLWGRASCGGTMVVDEGTRFQRLAAPRIELGGPGTGAEPTRSESHIVPPPSHATAGSGRWAMAGDFTVPECGVIDSDLVISGTLTVGRGARLNGAVRSRVVIAAADCTFARSVVAAERVTVGPRCRIAGPVVVEGEAVFGEGCRIGEPGDETTISALYVRVGPGVVLCGEVWVRRQGIVDMTSPDGSSDAELEPVSAERAPSW